LYIAKLQCNEEKPLNDIPKERVRHFRNAAPFLYRCLFMYEFFFPAHTPFGEGTENEHSADSSFADFE
jgi:hypothetical protein